MKHGATLTIASLLSILLMSFHLSDDVVRGMEPGGTKNIAGVLILAAWLYGTLALAGRRSSSSNRQDPPRSGSPPVRAR